MITKKLCIGLLLSAVLGMQAANHNRPPVLGNVSAAAVAALGQSSFPGASTALRLLQNSYNKKRVQAHGVAAQVVGMPPVDPAKIDAERKYIQQRDAAAALAAQHEGYLAYAQPEPLSQEQEKTLGAEGVVLYRALMGVLFQQKNLVGGSTTVLPSETSGVSWIDERYIPSSSLFSEIGRDIRLPDSLTREPVESVYIQGIKRERQGLPAEILRRSVRFCFPTRGRKVEMRSGGLAEWHCR